MINITKNEIKFNDLEEKMWKKKMQEGLDELRDQLRRIDNQLLKDKDNEELEVKDFQKTNCIYSLKDKANLEFNFKLFWFDNSNYISVHRDNTFFKSFGTLQEAKKYVYDNYNVYKEHDLKLSEQTGCNILEFDTLGKDLSSSYELE